MLATPMIDPLGSLITELRADLDVKALVGVRVRGEEPAPGDARGPFRDEDPEPGYQAFIVLTTFEDPPHPSIPIQRAVYGVNCYGVTYQGARAVWGAVVKAMHRRTAREKTNGLGIYISVIDSGGEAGSDPQTGQPVIRGTLRVIATAQALA